MTKTAECLTENKNTDFTIYPQALHALLVVFQDMTKKNFGVGVKLPKMGGKASKMD